MDDPSQFLMSPPGQQRFQEQIAEDDEENDSYINSYAPPMSSKNQSNIRANHYNPKISHVKQAVLLQNNEHQDDQANDGEEFDSYKYEQNFNDIQGASKGGISSINQENYPISDSGKDDIITKLRVQNGKLRTKLKELNAALDQALEKAQRNMAFKKNNNLPPNIETLLRTKDKEIANQQQQIQNLKKEISSLKIRFDSDAGVDKAIKYENQLKEAEKRNQELVREIKALQKIQNEQGKALEKISNENEYVTKIKTLMEELKFAKDKLREMEEKQRKEEKTVKSQFEHMIKLQEKCKELKTQHNDSKQKQANDETDDKDKMIEELREKVKDAERNKEILEKAKEVEVKTTQQMKKRHMAQVKELTAQVEFIAKQLKEKDQESKIASSKLKEITKNVKHNALTPINFRAESSVEQKLKQLHPVKRSQLSSIRPNNTDRTKGTSIQTQPSSPSRNAQSEFNKTMSRRDTEKQLSTIQHKASKLRSSSKLEETTIDSQLRQREEPRTTKIKENANEDEFYTYDEKDFEKRYGQKLISAGEDAKSGQDLQSIKSNHFESSNINHQQSKEKQILTTSQSLKSQKQQQQLKNQTSQKTVTDYRQSQEDGSSHKYLDQYDQELGKSDLTSINHKLDEEVHDSYV